MTITQTTRPDAYAIACRDLDDAAQAAAEAGYTAESVDALTAAEDLVIALQAAQVAA